MTLESLRAAIGVVFQEAMLFNRSIRDNSSHGPARGHEFGSERACKLADAHDFIMRQPQGYGTMVGEPAPRSPAASASGSRSPRALLKDPPILILDEATSALDANGSPREPGSEGADAGPRHLIRAPAFDR